MTRRIRVTLHLTHGNGPITADLPASRWEGLLKSLAKVGVVTFGAFGDVAVMTSHVVYVTREDIP